jgi:hypothetical protein
MERIHGRRGPTKISALRANAILDSVRSLLTGPGFANQSNEPRVRIATAACVAGRAQGQNDHDSGPGRLSIAGALFVGGCRGRCHDMVYRAQSRWA